MVDIRFTNLKIGEVSTASGVFSGTNVMHGWKHEEKRNEGFGNMNGEHNRIQGGVHAVYDQDLIDQWMQRKGRRPHARR